MLFNNYPYYNSYFPYNNYNNQPLQQQNQNNSNNVNNTIHTQNVNWIPVNGIEGAKNHIVQPNATAWLLDNNKSRFYVKSADSLGVTSLKIYDFQEVNEENEKTEKIDLNEYVKRSEIDKIINEKINSLSELYLKTREEK